MQLFTLIVLLVSLIRQSQASYDCTIIPGNGTVDINDCSNFPIYIDEAIMTNCSEAHPDPSDLPIGTCVAQCILNATNVIISDTGKVNQQLFENLVNSKSTGDWAPIASAALDHCFKLASAQEATINGMTSNSTTSSPDCDAQASVLMSCLYMQLFVNTPNSAFNQNSNSACVNLKEFVKNCAIE